MKRKKTTIIGDVFSVKVDERHQKFFQYVINDMTMLNSSVIRVFKETYPLETPAILPNVVKGEVEFYAHTILRAGLDNGCWTLEGNCPDIGKAADIKFRIWHPDDELPDVNMWRWSVWKVNQNMKRIGRLTEKYRTIDIGSVLNPWTIAARIRTGKFDADYLNVARGWNKYESFGNSNRLN